MDARHRKHEIGTLMVRIEGQREETERLLRTLVERDGPPNDADLQRLRSQVKRNHQTEADFYGLCDTSAHMERLVAVSRRQHEDLERRVEALVERPTADALRTLADRLITHYRFEDREVFAPIVRGCGG